MNEFKSAKTIQWSNITTIRCPFAVQPGGFSAISRWLSALRLICVPRILACHTAFAISEIAAASSEVAAAKISAAGIAG